MHELFGEMHIFFFLGALVDDFWS